MNMLVAVWCGLLALVWCAALSGLTYYFTRSRGLARAMACWQLFICAIGWCW